MHKKIKYFAQHWHINSCTHLSVSEKKRTNNREYYSVTKNRSSSEELIKKLKQKIIFLENIKILQWKKELKENV